MEHGRDITAVTPGRENDRFSVGRETVADVVDVELELWALPQRLQRQRALRDEDGSEGCLLLQKMLALELLARV